MTRLPYRDRIAAGRLLADHVLAGHRWQNAVVLGLPRLATGSTMQAAVAAVRAFHPAEVVVAVPVGSDEAVARLERVADEVICPAVPEPFGAIGAFYDDFSQVSNDEVEAILEDAYAATPTKAARAARSHEA